MKGLGAIAILCTGLLGAGADASSGRLVFASPSGPLGPRPSPRQLFNAGLVAEDEGHIVEACELYLGARLAARVGVAGARYARAAGNRLLRLVAQFDDDAAVAASLAARELATQTSNGRAEDPLARAYLRLLHQKTDVPFMLWQGRILSTRASRQTDQVYLEIELEDGERRVFAAEQSPGLFSAGARVRALVRRVKGQARTRWGMVAMGRADEDGWSVLRVRGIPTAADVAVGRPRMIDADIF